MSRFFCRTVRLPAAVSGLTVALAGGIWLCAQQPQPAVPVFHSKVDLVVLTFTVTDSKGKYVNGLKPSDFRITEDGIPQKLSTFAEGDRPAIEVGEGGALKPLSPQAAAAATATEAAHALRRDLCRDQRFSSVRYQQFHVPGFVYAEDAIGDFIRGLDKADSVAVYTFSRNLSRAADLSTDHLDAIRGLRTAVAGDDTALYNGLLLGLRDAAKVPGRKVVIVFSNGPDNASMVAPDDVRTVAEDEGIPIYVISTNDVNKDPISSSVFRRITQSTGRKGVLGENLAEAGEAFDAIREDIGNSYAVTYYPAPNPNDGFRKIDIQIVSDAAKKYRVRARPGYRPRSY